MTALRTHKLFRVFYNTFYFFLNVVLFVLVLITPGDAIQQALKNKQPYNVFVVAGCYILTVGFAILIYSARLYTNRSVLSAIPKTWVPVEKGDVNKKVRKMIVGSLSRSAVIAWDSRPRIPQHPATIISEPERRDPITRPAGSEMVDNGGHRVLHKDRSKLEGEEDTVVIPPERPVWGDIAHDGWSSPISVDLPNLQYTTVIHELPHLIEARAVSLAPPDPESISEPPLPDIRAVDLLQRPTAMGLRDYIGHLSTVGIITSPSNATDFLSAYEHARFSTRPLSELQFRNLMENFAKVLRSMSSLSPAILASLDINPPESDIDDDGTSTSTPRSQSPVSSSSTSNGSRGTIRTVPSRRVAAEKAHGSPPKRLEGFTTSPVTPRNRRRAMSRSPSVDSFAQSRHPYDGSSGGSNESLHSTSHGSVIRLSPNNEERALPYTIITPEAS